MPVPREAFVFVSIAGIWPQIIPSKPAPQLLYKCYRLFCYASMTVTLLTMGSALLLYSRDLSDFTGMGFLVAAGANSYVKSTNLLLRGQGADKIRRMFLRDVCQASNEAEEKACRYYKLYSRYMVIVAAIVAELCALCVGLLPFFIARSDDRLNLPYAACYPFEIAPGSLLYWIVYLHQWHSALMISAWNGSNDALISAFLLELCAQLQLLTHRLKVLPREMRLLRESFEADEETIRQREARAIKRSVEHHLHIVKIAELLQAQFLPNMISQFVLCTIILCMNIYQVAVKKSSAFELAMQLIYLYTILTEHLFYCWFGNELVSKSSRFNEALFQTDWTSLHVQTQKELLMVMKRAHKPIRITCEPFITLSTESFIGLVKCSYSVYNVLKQS